MKGLHQGSVSFPYWEQWDSSGNAPNTVVACVCWSGFSDGVFALCQTCRSPTTVRSAVSASRRWTSIGSTSRSFTPRSSTSVPPAVSCLPAPPSWTNTSPRTLGQNPSAVISATSHTRYTEPVGHRDDSMFVKW